MLSFIVNVVSGECYVIGVHLDGIPDFTYDFGVNPTAYPVTYTFDPIPDAPGEDLSACYPTITLYSGAAWGAAGPAVTGTNVPVALSTTTPSGAATADLTFTDEYASATAANSASPFPITFDVQAKVTTGDWTLPAGYSAGTVVYEDIVVFKVTINEPCTATAPTVSAAYTAFAVATGNNSGATATAAAYTSAEATHAT